MGGAGRDDGVDGESARCGGAAVVDVVLAVAASENDELVWEQNTATRR